MDEFVTKEELSEERNADDFIDWFDNKRNELSKSSEAVEAIRLRSGLCKQLVEEILPLEIHAKQLYKGNKCISIQPVIGSQPYDAVIRDKSKTLNEATEVEITLAYEGQNEYYRRLMLHKTGRAPATGKISVKVSKDGEYDFEEELPVARDVEQLLEEQLVLISAALDRKYKNDYGSDTVLIVMFEDVLSFRETEEIEKLDELLVNYIRRNGKKFQNIYLHSWSGNVCIMI